MCPQRVQNLPDDLVFLIVVEGLLRRDPSGDTDREDDITHLLAGSAAHDAANRLDDIDLRLPRMEEHDGVERRDIDALAQAPRVRQDAAAMILVLRLQPFEFAGARLGIEGAIDMVDLTPQRGVLIARGRSEILIHHGGELVTHQLGGCDVAAEGQRPTHMPGVARDILGEVGLSQRLIAADDLGRIVELEFVVRVLEAVLDAGADHRLIDGEDDHLIVGQQVILDGPAKAPLEQRLTIKRGIVHRA